MSTLADTRHIEPHGGQWRVVVRVPRHLVPILGKTVLKRGLKTDSLKVAQTRRWAVRAELLRIIREAAAKSNSAPLDPITEEALKQRDYRARTNDPEALDQIDEWVYWDRREEIERDHGPAKALEYVEIATGKKTPLTLHLDRWIADSPDKEKRTLKHFHTTVTRLAEYATEVGWPQTIEAFDRRRAGEFISRCFIQKSVPHKTTGKFISALSSYWRWLEYRGHIPRSTDNPWLRQPLPRPKQNRGGRSRQKEREFTDDELMTLLDPKASAGDPMLGDFMHIAALSGMRIDEIANLKAEDVKLNAATKTVSIEEAKTEAGVRTVPIHPELEGIIKSRLNGKAPGDWLFDELPEYPPESMSERSMIVSKRFVTYRRRLGVDERVEGKRRSLVNFHSFRRWFITKAEQAGVPTSTIAVVVGHETGREGMTLGVYSGGPSLEQRHACVEAVKLPSKPAV
jgi:integrase